MSELVNRKGTTIMSETNIVAELQQENIKLHILNKELLNKNNVYIEYIKSLNKTLSVFINQQEQINGQRNTNAKHTTLVEV